MSFSAVLKTLRPTTRRAGWNRRCTDRAFAGHAAVAAQVEHLDARTMLSAGGTCVVDVMDGSDVNIDAAADNISKIVVAANADVGQLTILGGADDLRVVVVDSAIVSTISLDGGSGSETIAVYGEVFEFVEVDGGDGNDTLAVFGSGFVSQIMFDGAGGDDSVAVRGLTDDIDHTITMGAGDDAVAVTDGGELLGTVFAALDGDATGLDTGAAGRDEFVVRRNSVVDDVQLDLGGGNDRFDLGSDSIGNSINVRSLAGDNLYSLRDSATQDFVIEGGSGRDAVVVKGIASISNFFTAQLGAGDDAIITEQLAADGVSFFLGSSDTRDTVRLGTMSATNVFATAQDDLLFTETGVQAINGNLTVRSLGGSLFLRLDQGSGISANLDYAGAASSIITSNVSTAAGSLQVTLAGGDDFLNLLDSSIGFDGTIAAGGGGDRIDLGTSSFDDFLFVDLGDGDDDLLNGGVTLLNDGEFDGGAGFDRIEDETIGTQNGFEGTI